jgi:ribonuclease Z
MTFEVTILGSNSSLPTKTRNPSSQVLNINDNLFLIDCGEGTQVQLLKQNIKKNRIEHIFISHLHGDHYLGLIGLIQSMHLMGRTKAIQLYGPPELKEIIDIHLKHSRTQLNYEVEFHPTQANSPEVIYETPSLIVETIILDHRIPCTGFLFKEKEKGIRLNKGALEVHEVGNHYIHLLKQGNDFEKPDGTIIPNNVFTKEPNPALSYAYCSDTAYKESNVEQLKNVDLMYHEATFLHEMLDRAKMTKHSTAKEAATIANMCGVRKLLIGHFSARYNDLTPLLDEAKETFENTFLAIEGETFSAL